MSKGEVLTEFSEGTVIPTESLLEIPCDVLIPAAIGGVITGAFVQ
jgi:glutamate dehydrogenase/leucine dehydrogenase